jgi:hypothetical protein
LKVSDKASFLFVISALVGVAGMALLAAQTPPASQQNTSGPASVESQQQASEQGSPKIPLIAPPADEPYQAFYGAHIQRSMTLLATSSAEHRWPVKILLYGQSIVGSQDFTDDLSNFLRQSFPYADLHIENRAIGGFMADRLVRTAVHDLYPYYPDLLIFHVYGGQDNGDLERIISNVRRYTTSDIVLFNDHRQRDHEISEASAAYFRYLAAKYDCELVDVSTEWPRYLREHHLEPAQMLRDGVHPNGAGYALLAVLIERHLRYNPLFRDPWDAEVRTYEAKRALADGASDEVQLLGDGWSLSDDGITGENSRASLRLEFSGNRVDLIAAHTKPGEKLGTARILIDGKPPSQDPAAIFFTRPSEGPNTWFPAIRRVSHIAQLIPEDWTLRITSINADATQFTFEVIGSKTGPDGKGTSSQPFRSNSGRVSIDPSDWMFADIMKIFKQTNPPPAGFEVHWSAVPLYVDDYRAVDAVDRSRVYATTLIQGIRNGKHSLAIIPNGDGPVPIQTIEVYRPPLRAED